MHVKVTGLERLEHGRTYVFVSNHQSIYDIPVLFWSLPYQLRIIAKASLGTVPFLGWHLRRTGHMLVDRSRPDRARIFGWANRLTANGLSLIVFPEGTRSRDGRVNRFKGGSFYLAIEAGLPVVPLSIVGSRHVMLKGRLAVHPGLVRLVVHDPIDTQGLAGSDPRAFGERVRQILAPGRGVGRDHGSSPCRCASPRRLISAGSCGRVSCGSRTPWSWPGSTAWTRRWPRRNPPFARTLRPTSRSVRTMYKRVGLDPTKTRPSSEALLRRVRRGDPLPRINAMVDVCNWCSLEFQLPYGLYDASHIRGDVELRLGREGESYAGIRKDEVHVGGRITLADSEGPFGNPTSDSARTMVTTHTTRALLVVFAPAEIEGSRLDHVLDVTSARMTEFTGCREAARVR